MRDRFCVAASCQGEAGVWFCVAAGAGFWKLSVVWWAGVVVILLVG